MGHHPGPHRVQFNVAITAQGIDNFSQARTRTLTWTAYNKPRTIREGALTLTFDYGADRARIRQVNNATLTTTTYVGNLYEKQVRGNTATHVHYLRAGGQVVALYRAQGRTSPSNPVGTPTSATTRYLHRDHLGSVTVITNENQGIVERLAYDAWGKRRAPTAAQTLGQLTSMTTLRGYSGHEMLDTVSLIHMNGRVYDPDLGRFLSADPTVQFPGYSQSYNRYSYVLNNPLSYTDPSGFGILGFFKGLFKGIGKLVKGVARFIGKVVRFLATNRIVQSLRTIAAGIACGPPCAAAAAGAHTALNGGGIGDIFKSMAITFASAQAFGELHQMEYGVGKIVAHGVVGGIANELRGGSFLAGFLSAGVTQALSPGIDMILPNNTAELGILTRTGAAAVVGGLGSVLGGGKFRDGAITGAFSRLFNDERENLKQLLRERVQTNSSINRSTGVHRYEIRGMICSQPTAGCDAQLADEVYDYVNRNDVPFIGDDLRRGEHDLLLGTQPIVHQEYPEIRRSVNVTQEGHTFHPGRVTHDVYFDNGNLYYDVTGTGTGRFPGLNNRAGIQLFRPGVEDVIELYGR